MRFTIIIEDGSARRTFDAGKTVYTLEKALEEARDFIEAADADPQAALDDEKEE